VKLDLLASAHTEPQNSHVEWWGDCLASLAVTAEAEKDGLPRPDKAGLEITGVVRGFILPWKD